MKQLSVRDTTRASIGTAALTVDYGRPLARGRVLLGNTLPYDHVWRTHLSRDKDAPIPRAAQPLASGAIVQVPHVGGLHHPDERRAA